MTISLLSLSQLLTAEEEFQRDYVGIVKTVLDLFDRQGIEVSRDDLNSTSLADLKDLKTPNAYRFQLRFVEFGISLVETLKVARDPLLRKQIVDMARWATRPAARADALLALASQSNPDHLPVFKEALSDPNSGIVFAAIEALQLWNRPEAASAITTARNLKWSPLLTVFAAQALVSLGDRSEMQTLWDGLSSPSWIVRAMAARYVGDYGQASDLPRVLQALAREAPPSLAKSTSRVEERTEFVVAELGIAALKLISKKEKTVSYSPATPGWKDEAEVKYSVGPGGVVEVEPLIIIPPRLRIQSTTAEVIRIDNELLRLAEMYLNLPVEKSVELVEPNLEDLFKLVTPAGYALRLRYAPDLTYLMVEAFAGTGDLRLRGVLEQLARSATNAHGRSAALVALAYRRNSSDVTLIEQALRSSDKIVRFGGLEAAEAGQFKEVLPVLTEIANGDSSPAFRVYASYILAKLGHPAGYPHLISATDNTDWPSRAMAFWFLGRYGDTKDYALMLDRMGHEKNPFVQTEICLAALRLTPL